MISAVHQQPLSHDGVICDVSKKETVFSHPVVKVKLIAFNHSPSKFAQEDSSLLRIANSA